MKYNEICKGFFLERPNRFIARAEVDGRQETVHVKNTGRCRELLTPRAEIWLSCSRDPKRKTAFDLVTVKKDGRLINMDSQAPNAAVREWLAAGGLYAEPALLRPETVYGSSRFDFYMEAEGKRIFIETKGVTLERDNVALFPDAPSVRAVKHMEELIRAGEEGYESYVIFVVQMSGIRLFRPNWENQPAFGEVLLRAREAGVRILAYGCQVEEDGMTIAEEIPVQLEREEENVLSLIAKPLLTWYDGHRRVLPWRELPTPYRVWVSEIMLQQTRVEAVKPYFARFMEALPDIGALAEAKEDVLLKLWEGLGYYNRVRNMQLAARQVMEQHGGVMPAAYEALLELKGIGSYTAGAIASIAYGIPVPAVDGNVLRVLARLRMDEGDILSQAVKKRVETELLDVMPKERPGDFNQALMELGATVCLPNGAPKCAECPWETLCAAHRCQRELEFPKKAAKRARTIEKKTVLVIQDGREVAIQKRPARGLLAGLYEFPLLEGHMEQDRILEYMKKLGVHAVRIKRLEDARHIFTHKEWHMIGYAIRVDELEPMKRDSRLIFAEPEETEEKYPIPSAFAAYSKYLNIRAGKERMGK